MDDADRVGSDDGQLMVGQVHDAVGVTDERRAVAGDEVLTVADADHERAAQPGGHDHVRPIAKDHRQAVGAAELRERRLNRFDQRRVAVGRRGRRRPSRVRPAGIQLGRHKLRDDLGIGRRFAVVAALGQLLLELAEVFDDAVVNERDDVVAADVRVGVRVGRRPVRGPARVAEADLAARGVRLQLARPDRRRDRPSW